MNLNNKKESGNLIKPSAPLDIDISRRIGNVSWIKYKVAFVQIIWIALACFIMIDAILPTIDCQADDRRVLFLGNESLPPMCFMKDGKPSGLVVDLAEALSKHMRQPVEIGLMNWTKAQEAVLDGGADALLQINPCPERLELFDFSGPLLNSEFMIFTSSERIGVQSIHQLRGLKVGVEEKGLPILLLQKDPEITIQIIPDFLQGFRMLTSGAIDAVVADRWAGSYVLAENNIQGVKLIDTSIGSGSSAIAVKKGNAELLEDINSALAFIQKDGTYDRIVKSWKPREVVFKTRDQIDRDTIFHRFMFAALAISLLSLAAMFNQIDKRKRQQELLKKSEERFDLAVRAAQEGVWDWNTETDEVWYSPRYKEMLGYSEDEIKNHASAWMRLVHPDDKEPSLEVVEAVKRGERNFEMEFRLRHKDGHYLDILTRGYPIRRKSDGKVVRVVGIHFDLTDLKRNEHKLKVMEERQRLALDAARMGTYHWDVATGAIAWSDMYCKIFGLPSNSPPGYDKWLASLLPEDRDAVDLSIHRAMEDRIDFNAEYRILRPDGSVRWISSKGRFFYGLDGLPVRMEGVLFDITERKLAEEELFKAKFILTEGQRIAHVGTFEFIAATGQTNWSEEECRIYGFDPAEPSPEYGAMLKNSIYPDDVYLLQKTFTAALQSGSIYEQEHRIIRPDGSVGWTYNLAHPYFDNTGRVERYIGTTLDITDRKLREEEIQRLNADLERKIEERTVELHASKEKYRLMVETINDCIWEMDSKGQFTYLSPAFMNITGYQPDEFLGKSPIDLFPKDGAARSDVIDLPELAALKPFSSLEYTIANRKGNRVFVEVNGVPAFKPDGSIAGFRGITRDISQRKTAEEALRLSEERLSLALMGADLGIWEWNIETGEIFLNSRMTEMLGYYENEIDPTMSSWRAILHPEDMTHNLEALNAHLAGVAPYYESEHRFLSKSGEWIWVSTKGKITLRDGQGRPIRMSGTHLDISSRKQAEDNLKLHLAVMETVEEGIYLIGIDDNIIKWTNPKFEKMFGYDPGEMAGMHFDIVNAPTVKTPAETLISIVEEILQTGEWHGEIENIRKDGTHFWCNVHVSLFDHPHFGKVMVSAHTDITERKRLELDIQRSERDLRAILNNIPSMVGYYDKDLRNRFGNIVYKDWYGIDPVKIPGMNIKDVLGEERFRKNLPHIEAALAGKPQIFERTLFLSGRSIVKYCIVHYVPDVLDGQVHGFYVLVSDITPIKVAEEQRKQLAKAESLNRMAGAIAHNFNNQLSVVIGNLELLMNDLSLGSESQTMMMDALTASHKSADISKMMLTYLGQSAGKKEVQDLSKTCHKGLLMAQSAIPKNVSLQTEIPFPGPAVTANTSEILQIVTNLITNAYESIIDRKGTVTISVITVSAADVPAFNRFPVDWKPTESSYAGIEIMDTGCSIPKENIEKIFDPFFTTKFTGRGLGLSVVLGILRTHGGVITFENRKGGGCAFRVYLPLAPQIVAVVTDKITKNAEVQPGGAVLLIDDQEQVRNMAKVMLSRQGYSVLEAGDGVEAVKVFQQNKDKIRLVITDLTMPRMNGWETITAIRKISPNISVILSSGYDESHVIAESEQNEQPDAFLGKPYHFKDLRETINRILAADK